MGTLIRVGDDFTLFQEKAAKHMDGCYLEALDENDGFIMAMYLGGMSQDEKDLLESARITTRMIKEGNKVLFINRYGDSPLLFEASFDPTLYKDRRAMQIAFDNHMLMIIGIERFSNKIQTLRQANFPMKLKQALITAWTSAYEEENYSKKYAIWLQDIYEHYTTFDLWERALPVGYFGEKGMFEV